MNQQNGDSFFSRAQKAIANFPRTIGEGWREDLVALRNWFRRRRKARLDYVVLPISGSLPERPGPPRSFLQRQLPLPPEPLSLQTLNERTQAIADAGNVRGVVLLLQELAFPGLSTVQNLRKTIQRLREAGKEVVVFTPYLDLSHYYAACAADRIIAPPGTQFEVLGLRVEAIFLRDALEQIGIEPEILQVSPYKTAFDMFDKSEMTEAQREQFNWLLDDNYDLITAEMAAGRGLSQEEMQALIDRAPFSSGEMLRSGLVDHIAYEDELPYLLARPEQTEPGTDGKQNGEEGQRPKARLKSWTQARSLLLEKARHPTAKHIGVVTLEGAITMGPSRQPPIDIPLPFIGGATAGEETISRLLRKAEKDESMAALIFHVDSGGGSALASDLIWRQVQRIAREKPVLVYMGNVAASGGYYVSAAARHIMCQPGTLTGSIGVIMGRINSKELLERLHVERTSLQRGEHAGLYRDVRPMTPEERELLWQHLIDTYEQFKAVVREGREMDEEQLEPLAGGRVWTGRQAQAHLLVDSHGDFVDAIRLAAELAELRVDDSHYPAVTDYHSRSQSHVLPEPFPAGRVIEELLTRDWVQDFSGKALALMPFDIRLH
jgi:protease-4